MKLEQLFKRLQPVLQTHKDDEVLNLSLEVEAPNGAHFQVETDDIVDDVIHVVTTTYAEVP